MAIRDSVVRIGLEVLSVAWLTPVLAVGLIGLSTPSTIAIALGFAAAILLTFLLRPTLRWIADAFAARPPAWAALILAAGLVAVVSTARLAPFMADPARIDHSYVSSAFSGHSCLLAYTEGTRLARAGDRNIYQMSEYRGRTVGLLRVDAYHYPPPFLLLPGAIDLVTHDFAALRAVWFMMQALVFAGAGLFVARWIGGEPGAWAAGGLWLLLASSPAISTLQVGNFQLTVVPLAMIAMVLLYRDRIAAGAALLAYAIVSKIFPGLLLVFLLAGRRWRAATLVVVACALFGAATIAAFGWRPVTEFVTYEIPRIASAEAFPQTEAAGVVPLNLSFYGLLVRLRFLGLTWLDVGTGLTLTSIYGVFALLLTAAAGWRVARAGIPATGTGRLALAQLLLALLTVASIRSPFVGSVYGFMITIWLLVLLAAGATTTLGRLACVAGIALLNVTHILTPTTLPSLAPTTPVSTTAVALTALVLVGLIALNVAVVVRVILRGELDAEPGPARSRLTPAPAAVAVSQ